MLTKYAAPYSGLGLLPLDTPVPAFWRITPLAPNNSAAYSHWTVPSGFVPEGVNATTPVPSVNGSTNQLNAGPYKFLVEAFDEPDGAATSSSVITITIQPGAASIGTSDLFGGYLGRYNGQTFPGSFILFSTGIDRANGSTLAGGRNQFSVCDFAHNVTFTHADPSRPGGICYIILIGYPSACSNVIVSGISFTGDLGDSVTGSLWSMITLSGANMTAINCNMTFNPDTCGQGAAVAFGGCISCAAIGINALGVGSGIVDNGETQNVDIQVTRFRVRQFYNNAWFVGNSNYLTMTDCVSVAPQRFTTDHVDNFQICDGCSPQNMKVIRYQMYLAEGNVASQGFFSGAIYDYQGFIDDGSKYPAYSGVAGKVLTITSTSGFGIIPWTWFAGPHFAGSVQVTDRPAGGVLAGQYSLNIAGNMLAPPGNLTTAPMSNLEVNGWAYAEAAPNAFGFKGLVGTSTLNAFTNTEVLAPLSRLSRGVVLAIANGYNLTVTETISGNPIFGGVLTWPNGTLVLNGTNKIYVSWTYVGNYYTLEYPLYVPAPTEFVIIADYPLPTNAGPSMGFKNADASWLYGGTTTVSSGFVWTSYPSGVIGYGSIYGEYAVPKPASITVDPGVVLGPSNGFETNYTATVFAQGNPNDVLNRLNTKLQPNGQDNCVWKSCCVQSSKVAWILLRKNLVNLSTQQSVILSINGNCNNEDLGGTAEACKVGHWTMLTNEKEKRGETLKNDMHKVHFQNL